MGDPSLAEITTSTTTKFGPAASSDIAESGTVDRWVNIMANGELATRLAAEITSTFWGYM